MWHSIAAFIIKFRVSLLIVLLGVTVVMAYYASKVTLSYEFNSAIPTDNPEYVTYQKFRKQFGEDGNLMVIGVQTDRFFEPSFFQDYAALVHKLEDIEAVENVLSIPGAVNLIKDTQNNKISIAPLVSRTDSVIDVAKIEQTFLNL